MITFNDVEQVAIDSTCHEHCFHFASLILKDGRITILPPILISPIISQLADEKVNPGQKWNGARVKHHFRHKRHPMMRLFRKTLASELLKEPPEVILNLLIFEVLENGKPIRI